MSTTLASAHCAAAPLPPPEDPTLMRIAAAPPYSNKYVYSMYASPPAPPLTAVECTTTPWPGAYTRPLFQLNLSRF
jgi:hypothetical protein